jgi:hypothetical protein
MGEAAVCFTTSVPSPPAACVNSFVRPLPLPAVPSFEDLNQASKRGWPLASTSAFPVPTEVVFGGVASVGETDAASASAGAGAAAGDASGTSILCLCSWGFARAGRRGNAIFLCCTRHPHSIFYAQPVLCHDALPQ